MIDKYKTLMSSQGDLGKKGELIARDFLEKNEYEILECNWRSGNAEIDIIASHDNIVIFVEVKTRSNESFGKPETFVNQKKQRLLSYAGLNYMDQKKHEWEVRFDIIAISFRSPQEYKIKHIKDAFFPNI